MIPKKGASQVLGKFLPGNSADLSTCMKRRKTFQYLMHIAASSFVCVTPCAACIQHFLFGPSEDLHFCWSDGAADHHMHRAATLDALTWVWGLLQKGNPDQKKGASFLQHVRQELCTLHGSRPHFENLPQCALSGRSERESKGGTVGFFDVSQMSPNGGCMSLFLATQFRESHVVLIVLRRRDCQDSHVEKAFSDACEELLPALHGQPRVIELDPFLPPSSVGWEDFALFPILSPRFVGSCFQTDDSSFFVWSVASRIVPILFL